MIAGTLTIPTLAMIAGMTLSSPLQSVTYAEPLRIANIASYDTISRNASLAGFSEYGNKNYSRNGAFSLFGEQSDFTKEELDFYKRVIKHKSTPVGINIYELFG